MKSKISPSTWINKSLIFKIKSTKLKKRRSNSLKVQSVSETRNLENFELKFKSWPNAKNGFKRPRKWLTKDLNFWRENALMLTLSYLPQNRWSLEKLINRNIMFILLWWGSNLLSYSRRIVLVCAEIELFWVFTFTSIERNLCCLSSSFSLLAWVLREYVWVQLYICVFCLRILMVSYLCCTLLSWISFSWQNSFSWITLILPLINPWR